MHKKKSNIMKHMINDIVNSNNKTVII